MSRNKAKPGRRSVSRAVSFFPYHIRHAATRANAASISFSRFVQALIEHDIRNDVLGRALTAGLDSKEKA